MDLVFADITSTRIIQEVDRMEDLLLNIQEDEYVLSDAIINPITKSNVETYIIKDNIKFSVNNASREIEDSNVMLNSFYYRTIKNRNVKIRCLDRVIKLGDEIKFLKDDTYKILSATNKLNGCLFVFSIQYKKNDILGNVEDKTKEFYFKVVSEKEFEMYKDVNNGLSDIIKMGVTLKPRAENIN